MKSTSKLMDTKLCIGKNLKTINKNLSPRISLDRINTVKKPLYSTSSTNNLKVSQKINSLRTKRHLSPYSIVGPKPK